MLVHLCIHIRFNFLEFNKSRSEMFYDETNRRKSVAKGSDRGRY